MPACAHHSPGLCSLSMVLALAFLATGCRKREAPRARPGSDAPSAEGRTPALCGVLLVLQADVDPMGTGAVMVKRINGFRAQDRLPPGRTIPSHRPGHLEIEVHLQTRSMPTRAQIEAWVAVLEDPRLYRGGRLAIHPVHQGGMRERFDLIRETLGPGTEIRYAGREGNAIELGNTTASKVRRALDGVPPPAGARWFLQKIYAEREDPDADPKVEGVFVWLASREPILRNDGITRVSAQRMDTGRPILQIEMTRAARRSFGKLTRRWIHKQLLVTFDDEVISAPVVAEPIPGGRASIVDGTNTLWRTFDEAGKMVAVLGGGVLPGPTRLLRAQVACSPSRPKSR